jgi:hypothetical protein
MASRRTVLPLRWFDEIVEALRRVSDELRSLVPPRNRPIEPLDPRLTNVMIVIAAAILACAAYFAVRELLLGHP